VVFGEVAVAPVIVALARLGHGDGGNGEGEHGVFVGGTKKPPAGARGGVEW